MTLFCYFPVRDNVVAVTQFSWWRCRLSGKYYRHLMTNWQREIFAMTMLLQNFFVPNKSWFIKWYTQSQHTSIYLFLSTSIFLNIVNDKNCKMVNCNLLFNNKNEIRKTVLWMYWYVKWIEELSISIMHLSTQRQSPEQRWQRGWSQEAEAGWNWSKSGNQASQTRSHWHGWRWYFNTISW